MIAPTAPRCKGGRLDGHEIRPQPIAGGFPISEQKYAVTGSLAES
jgi:hypothetical protein